MLNYFNSSNAKFRGLSLNTVNCILLVQNDSITSIIDQFLEALFQLANDNDQVFFFKLINFFYIFKIKEVQKQLCRSLTLLLENYIDKIAPQLSNISEFMLIKSQDENEDIALEACEFWLAFAEKKCMCKEVIGPILPRLLPILIKSMKYSEADICALKVSNLFYFLKLFNFLFRAILKTIQMCQIVLKILNQDFIVHVLKVVSVNKLVK